MGVAEAENLLKKIKSLLFQSGCIRKVQRLLWKTFHSSLVYQAKVLGLGGLPEVISVWAVLG